MLRPLRRAGCGHEAPLGGAVIGTFKRLFRHRYRPPACRKCASHPDCSTSSRNAMPKLRHNRGHAQPTRSFPGRSIHPVCQFEWNRAVRGLDDQIAARSERPVKRCKYAVAADIFKVRRNADGIPPCRPGSRWRKAPSPFAPIDRDSPRYRQFAVPYNPDRMPKQRPIQRSGKQDRQRLSTLRRGG